MVSSILIGLLVLLGQTIDKRRKHPSVVIALSQYKCLTSNRTLFEIILFPKEYQGRIKNFKFNMEEEFFFNFMTDFSDYKK